MLSEYRKSILNFIAKKTVLNMKNKEFYKLLKKNQSNSGFTLIELLVGLVMSIFVIGALGFGLMTVLQTNQRENSKVKARTENSRALDFISDEVRRAKNIESDTTINAPGFPASSDKTVVLALDIPEISDSATMDSDKDATTTNERIVYYLSSNIGPNWKGPQVLYRWGPPLDINGKYTDGLWDSQALIDGINTTPVTNPCSTGTVSTVNPTGFYACISLQDPAKAYDPNSLIPDPLDPSKNIQNPNYNPRNTAQLFLTGQTKTATGVNDNQTNDTQVVARARTRAANSTNTFSSISWSMKSLGGKYECKRSPSVKLWGMRTDFGNDSTNPNKTTTWIQDSSSGTQPQPLEVDPTKDLTVTSSAILADTDPKCNSIGNPNVDGKEPIDDPKYLHKVPIEVKFDNPVTFNGDEDGNPTRNVSEVKTGDPRIQFLKKGDIPLYGGYVANPSAPSPDDQPSLGRFLYEKGMAIISPTNTTLDDPTTPENEILNNPLTQFIIPTSEQLAASNLTEAKKSDFTLLEDDQRIVAFEVGQTSPTLNGKPNPGFDLQDNIFVVTSDVFKTKFESSCFSGAKCSPSTGKPE
jgi:type II secretory pathway pseudopilin PulG